MDGRIKTLSGVLRITILTIYLISIIKMSDAGVKTMFENKMYRIVQGAMALPRGVKL